MHNKAAVTLAVIVMIASGYAVITAWSWPWKAALFPLVIAVPVFLLATAEAILSLRGSEARGDATKDFQLSTHLPQKEALRRTGIAIGWIVGLFAAIVLLGFPIAIPLFVFLFLKVQGREGWLLSIVFAAVIWAIFYGLFDRMLHLPFPQGLIQDWTGLG